MLAAANEIRNQWRIIDEQWNAIHGPNSIARAGSWDEWYRDYLVTVASRARIWLRKWIKIMRDNYEAGTDARLAAEVSEVLNEIEGEIDDAIKINIDGLI
jgi:hypothetical protein